MLSSVVNISENESPANKSQSTYPQKNKLNKQAILLNNVCLCACFVARLLLLLFFF